MSVRPSPSLAPFGPWLAAGLLGLASLTGCKAESSGAATEQAAKPEAATSAARPAPVKNAVGAPISAAAELPLKKLLAFPEEHAGKTVVVSGMVRRNCTKKGCWMELATGLEPDALGCRVTFQDYAFFVPTDSVGSQARVEGQVLVRELDKAQVDHLEAEGAHFGDKSADGTAQELRIVATGVELTRS
ncbi:MAG TPA: DUF4920 domain-containing protein [Polyangiaceae bacterium]|nr:DUF4920 domain-containing protein [Polyangiaceae bacterium]